MKEIDIDEWIEWINQPFALKRENTWIMSVDMKEMRERQIMKEIDTEAVFKFQVSNWNLISLDPGFLIELLRVNFDIFWPLQNDICQSCLEAWGRASVRSGGGGWDKKVEIKSEILEFLFPWYLNFWPILAIFKCVYQSSRVPDTCSGDSGGGLVARRGDDR